MVVNSRLDGDKIILSTPFDHFSLTNNLRIDLGSILLTKKGFLFQGVNFNTKEEIEKNFNTFIPTNIWEEFLEINKYIL